MKDPSYRKIRDILAPAHKGITGMLHFDVQGDLDKTFSMSTTEIAQFTLKEGKVKADLDDFLTKWMPKVGRAEYYVQGVCVEKPELVGLFVGWNSVEVSCCGLGQEYFFDLLYSFSIIKNFQVKPWGILPILNSLKRRVVRSILQTST